MKSIVRIRPTIPDMHQAPGATSFTRDLQIHTAQSQPRIAPVKVICPFAVKAIVPNILKLIWYLDCRRQMKCLARVWQSQFSHASVDTNYALDCRDTLSLVVLSSTIQIVFNKFVLLRRVDLITFLEGPNNSIIYRYFHPCTSSPKVLLQVRTGNRKYELSELTAIVAVAEHQCAYHSWGIL